MSKPKRLYRLTINLRNGKTVTHPHLGKRQAGALVFYCLYDNGAADRKEARRIASEAENGAPISAYGYSFHIEPEV